MTFILYSKSNKDGKIILHKKIEYELAGNKNGHIYKIWLGLEKKCPTNRGWRISANDILKSIDPSFNTDNHELVIDYDPKSKERIGLVSIKEIYLFTIGTVKTVEWTPMMFILEDIYYYKDTNKHLSDEEKDKHICDISPNTTGRIVEFLYLGSNWKWGSNGRTNAAFLYGEPLNYFKKFL